MHVSACVLHLCFVFVSASVRVHSICPDNVVGRYVYLTTQEGLDVVPIAVDWKNGKVSTRRCDNIAKWSDRGAGVSDCELIGVLVLVTVSYKK